MGETYDHAFHLRFARQRPVAAHSLSLFSSKRSPFLSCRDLFVLDVQRNTAKGSHRLYTHTYIHICIYVYNNIKKLPIAPFQCQWARQEGLTCLRAEGRGAVKGRATPPFPLSSPFLLCSCASWSPTCLLDPPHAGTSTRGRQVLLPPQWQQSPQ